LPVARSNSRVQRIARRQSDRLDGFIRQQRAAEVGVQHRASQVKDAAHSAAVLIGEPFARAACKHCFGQLQRRQLTVAGRFPQFIEQIAQGAEQGVAAITLLQWRTGGSAQQLVDGR
jgi:hypothetical protein